MNTTASSPKLLCITNDRQLTQLVDKTMVSQQGSHVCHVPHIEQGVDQLQSDNFDAVLLDSHAAENDPTVVAQLQQACRQTPLMIASEREFATQWECESRTGLSDEIAIVPKRELDEQRLALEVLRMLAARESQLQVAMRANLDRLLHDAQPASEGNHATAQAPASFPADVPASFPADVLPRCDLSARLIAVRGSLPLDARSAQVVGVSQDYLNARLPETHPDEKAPTSLFDTRMFVLGVQQDGVERFEFYQAIHEQNGVHTMRRLGLERLFPPDDCTPRLQGHYVRLGLTAEMTDAWEAFAVLQSRPVDRILVCPRCGAIPSLRPGCRSCGSPWVNSQRMIHHFPCAYVAPEEDFLHDDQLRCPKCLVGQLVMGADCEHLPGPAECRECHWQDTQREMYGRCFECSHVFPAAAAVEQEVIRYDVDRLEPLGLLATS